jgi:hypothetical protein
MVSMPFYGTRKFIIVFTRAATEPYPEPDPNPHFHTLKGKFVLVLN